MKRYRSFVLLLIFLSAIFFVLVPVPVNAVAELSMGRIEQYDQITTNVTSNELTSPYGTIVVEAEVNNTDNVDYVLYLMKYKETAFIPIKVLGVIEPNSRVKITIKIGVMYEEKTYNKVTYAIVLSDENETFKGKVFDVIEDWSNYESSIAVSLLRAHILAVPLISLIIILLILILIDSAYHYKFRGLIKGEYTVSTLFFPKLAGRPVSEKIADVMMNPLFWMIEIAFSILMFSFLVRDSLPRGDIGFDVLLLSGLAAFVFPLLYLSMTWVLERKPLRFFVAMFLFGMVCAFFAFVANTIINTEAKLLINIDTASFLLISAVVIAPFVEEIIKLFGLIFFAGHHEFDDALTGLMFGFAVGIGFSFMENWFYFTSKTNPFDIGFMGWLQLIVYRSFFNSLAHGSITGMCGAVIGYVKSITHMRKYILLSFISALFIAIPLHSLFNLTALMDGSVKRLETVYGLPFVFNPIFVVLLTLLFVIVYMLSAKERRTREKQEI